jgi:aldehyde dehydrogenase (NAD+)
VLDITQRIASGTMWVNETQHLSPTAAFGGMKQSGVGVEGGLEGLLEYTNVQTIVRRRKAISAV